MERAMSSYESAVAWINPGDTEQRLWIEAKLTPEFGGHWGYNYPGHDIQQVVLAWLLADPWRLPKVLNWQKAWNQKSWRAKNPTMKQVNVSLDRTHDKQLETLANCWRTTKAGAVRRLIVDAVAETRKEKAEYKAQKKRLQERVKQFQDEQGALRGQFNRAIGVLYRHLDELLPAACLMEMLDPDGLQDGDSFSDPDLRKLVKTKVKDINSGIQRSSLMRFPDYKGPFAEDPPTDP